MGVIRLTGTLTCAAGEADALRAALPAHVRPGRAGPEAHQARTRASGRWRATGHMAREFTQPEA